MENLLPVPSTVANRIARCRACAEDFACTRDRHRPRPVLRISSRARICICGQAPGRLSHKSGLPFDDPSGDRLRSWMSVDRSLFYDTGLFAFAPMAFCFPGAIKGKGDLPPPLRCAELWREQVLASMPQVELHLLVGGHAQRWQLPGEQSLADAVRGWRRHLPGLLVLPHPSWRNTAWLRRHPWFEEEVVPVLRRRLREILKNRPRSKE